MAASSFAASLIGVPDEKIDHSTHTSWDINKIGGKPDWLSSHTPHPKCNACQSLLTLVTQLYCPLEGSLYHRAIYVFTCQTEPCQQESYSFRVFRAQKRDEDSVGAIGRQPAPVQEPVNDAVTFDTDWCDDADDWGDEDETGDGADILDVRNYLGIGMEKSFAAAVATGNQTSIRTTNISQSNANGLEQSLQQLSLHPTYPTSSLHQEKSSPTPPISAWSETVPKWRDENVPELVSYFINVFDEPSVMSEELLTHERQLMKEYQEREGVSLAEWQDNALAVGGSGGDSAGGEGYEKVTAKHGDRTFQKFVKKIQPCPEQCIRYSYGGKPLWLTDPAKQSTHVPSCTHCGSQRYFEFQLMPALLPSLQSNDKRAPPIDFGVVVVYTCSRSCWPEDCSELLREEVVVVQHDPDSNAIVQAEQKLAQIQQNQR